jgi:hypothetical protein
VLNLGAFATGNYPSVAQVGDGSEGAHLMIKGTSAVMER